MYLCTVTNIVANNTNGMKNRTTTDLYVDDLMLRGDTALLWWFGGGYVELNANGFWGATLNPLVYAEDWHLAMRCSNDVLVFKVGTWRHFWGMAAGAFFGRMAIIKYFNGFRMGYETVVE